MATSKQPRATEAEYQMFRIRRDAHRKAKAAAGVLGVTLEQFASDALAREADKVMSRKAAK